MWVRRSAIRPVPSYATLPAHALESVRDNLAEDDEEARSQFSEKELCDLSIAIAMINSWNRLAIGGRAVHPNDRQKAA